MSVTLTDKPGQLVGRYEPMGQTGFKPTIDLKQFDALAADGDLSRGGQQVEISAGNQSDT
jgi:hypothetical protein